MGAAGDTILDQSIRESVDRSTPALRESLVLSGPIADGSLMVVGAHYELETGVVTFATA